MGTRKAAVFPEPVGAQTNTSRPFNVQDSLDYNNALTCSRRGMVCICTGVGSL